LTSQRQILLGWKLAADLDRQVGDRMRLFGTSFTVVGIVETGSSFEDNGAIISLREAQRLLKKPRQVMAMEIKLKDPRGTDALIERLTVDYPQLNFQRSAEFSEGLPDMQMTDDAIRGIYIMTIIVGSVSLMNTMIMSVYERTREIGVLRAIGWRRRLVLEQILHEAVLLTLVSGAAGLVLSVAISAILHSAQGTSIYGDMVVITPQVVAQAIGFCLVLGVVGGLYPAFRATKFSPVEALRYE